MLKNLVALSLLFGSSHAIAKGDVCEQIFGNEKTYVIPSTPLGPEQINYRFQGKAGAPVVVLIHGLGGNLHTWDKVAPELEREYKVLRFDLRGHGKTEKVGEDYSTEIVAKDLNVLLEHLGIEKANVIGHSLGARTAMQFANLFPEKVHSLVLEDMEALKRQEVTPEKVAKHLGFAEIIKGLKEHYPDRISLVMELLPHFKNDVERALRFSMRISREDQKTGEIFIENQVVKTLMGFQANTDDFGPMLQKIESPVMFLRADPELTPFFTDEGEAHIRRNNPNAKVVMIEEADHNIHWSDFGSWMYNVRRFLKTNAN